MSCIIYECSKYELQSFANETDSPEQLREDLSADPFAWYVHCRALAQHDTGANGAARKVRAITR